MLAIQLPDCLMMMRELVQATAEADVIGMFRGPAQPGSALLDQWREQHLRALVEMAQRGEICPLSVYRTRIPDFKPEDVDRCMVSFSDAQKFCRTLDIVLKAQPDEAAPVQPAATPHQGNNTAKTRLRDEADVFIDAALEAVKPSDDFLIVWSKLQIMAAAKPQTGTLFGVADGKLQYLKNGEVAYLSRNALRQRLKRRNTP